MEPTKTEKTTRPENLLGFLRLEGGRILRAFKNKSTRTGDFFIGYSLGITNEEGEVEYELYFANTLPNESRIREFVAAIEAAHPELIQDMVIF